MTHHRSDSSNKNQSIFLEFNCFPINSDQDLDKIEEYLKTNTNFQAVVSLSIKTLLLFVKFFGFQVEEYSKLGGSNPYDFIRRCLNVTMTNSFASQFSWHGAKKKRVFGNLKLAQMLLGKHLL